MQTFDQSLVQLTKEGLVAEEEARRAATNPHDFDLQMGGVLDRLPVGESEGLPF
jgi:Tfp pilus assembly ATPase PilU